LDLLLTNKCSTFCDAKIRFTEFQFFFSPYDALIKGGSWSMILGSAQGKRETSMVTCLRCKCSDGAPSLRAAYPLSLLRFFSKALWQSPVIVLVHADRRTADIQHDTPRLK
jgi:hypothetical protein